MAKFYARNGGVLLSQMPFGEVTEKNMPLDVMVRDKVGDFDRFRIRVVARNEDCAIRILYGVMRTCFVGITITDSATSLFGEELGDGVHGYILYDTTSGCSSLGNAQYLVTLRGHLVYKDVLKWC